MSATLRRSIFEGSAGVQPSSLGDRRHLMAQVALNPNLLRIRDALVDQEVAAAMERCTALTHPSTLPAPVSSRRSCRYPQ